MLPKMFRGLARSVQTTLRRSLTATTLDEGRFVEVQAQHPHPDEQTMKFPAVWLRDNCSCAECFHESSQSRRINWDHFRADVKATHVQGDPETGELSVRWSDRHQSTYSLQWLREREFSEKRRRSYLSTFYRPKTEHWCGADFDKIVETFAFDDVMHSDEALRSWLQALAVRGVALIKDSPLEKSVVRQLADRVGFIRRTTYGEEFIVQSKPGAKNYAYLSDPLPLHTDLPYYEYKPSVNILHCLVQSTSPGGSNLLVDAFHVADRLRAEQPDAYRILAETPVDWNDIGSEEGRSFHNIWRAPVICLDAEGEYARINHSIPQRDSHFSVPLAAVLPWYEAYGRFVRMARADAHAFKTRPGDVLTFNNIRLLHGRTGYDDTEGNVRYIVGAYLDWDIIYSKLRVLQAARPQPPSLSPPPSA